MTDAAVNLWGRQIGAVSWVAERGIGVFQYNSDFLAAGIELSPVVMPAHADPYEFPDLGKSAFRGLPGLLADSLPDTFGNQLINVWLVDSGRRIEDFSPVDRLSYIGSRGMGALEFEPAIPRRGGNTKVDIAQLRDLAESVTVSREQLSGVLKGINDRDALEDILAVGTSAGGARAKAVLAWNPKTGEFRSGQVDANQGFEQWILKFDGVKDGNQPQLGDPQGYGRIEYAYHRMARDAGIEMSKCRLHHEGGRSHFMTKRFDRTAKGGKVHMQTFGALRHLDYNAPGAASYEQAIDTVRELGMGLEEAKQQYRRAVFNVAARNQDDHVKNIAFLMDRSGRWRLSPAYDVTYSYNPVDGWTKSHQMSLAGKRKDFVRDDLFRSARVSGVPLPAARKIVDEVLSAVANWPQYAAEAGLPKRDIDRIGAVHRIGSLKKATGVAHQLKREHHEEGYSDHSSSP